MTLYDQIKQWLDSEEKDFNTGLQMYISASHNRSVMQYLQRKQDQRKLEYELQKLVKLLSERIKKMETIPFVKMAVIDKEKPVIKKPVRPDVETHKIMEPRKINPDDLPKEQREIYDLITLAYKEQRVCHEKMKLAKTDKERAEHRAKLLEYDDAISLGWNKLDEWDLIENQPPKPEKDETIADQAKTINACRSYISKGIKALPGLTGQKAAKRIAEINERIDILIRMKIPVKAETRNELIKLKVIDKNSLLQIDMPITVKPIP